MGAVFHSYCEFHFGDNLAHLHFLRALAKKYPEHTFTHAVYRCHLDQLQEAVEDLPNIKLEDLEAPSPLFDRSAAANVWKNAAGFWQGHPYRNDYGHFYLDFFAHLAREMGLENPFMRVSDLLFDYPAIKKPTLVGTFDFLVVNSQPCSGQFRAYDDVNYFDPVIEALLLRGNRVAITQRSPLQEKFNTEKLFCTRDHDLSISGVGNISLFTPNIIMVSTGPSWPTFNVWNKETVKFRCICLDHERVNLANHYVARNRDEVFAALKSGGLL